MKKWLYVLLLVVGVYSQNLREALASCDVVDFYSESNYTTDERLTTDPPGYSKIYQSFQSDTDNAICKAGFYLKNVNSATGNVYAELWSHSGTFGTNSVGSSLLATSYPVDASSIGSSFSMVDFTFDGSYHLVNGTYYVIAVMYNSGSHPSTGIQVGEDSSGGLS